MGSRSKLKIAPIYYIFGLIPRLFLEPKLTTNKGYAKRSL